MNLPNGLKDYFSFTKKERIGVITLITLIIFVFLLPKLFSPTRYKTNQADFEKFKNEIAGLKDKGDSNNFFLRERRKDDEMQYPINGPNLASEKKTSTELFYFDPNNTSVIDWKRLGLREKTILTINNYISKGGKFRKAEDLQKIYGLHENEYQRLLPYVKIENPGFQNHADKKVGGDGFHVPLAHQPKIIEPIDINEADTSSFVSLNGIGSRLANRIIGFRDRLGGFYSVDQIAETYYLPDSTFQKIKPFLKLGKTQLRKININTADAGILKGHPYIDWNLANAIVQYRKQHGDYQSVDALKSLVPISSGQFEKISPYLSIN